MDLISLFPMEVLYFFTGVNSLLRFPRLLKVSVHAGVMRNVWKGCSTEVNMK